uniref:Uncharacterized protein n=1 Tax=Meloidogyne hapla TaxID=6305 RepID=A0A1I8BHF6_MELHA
MEMMIRERIESIDINDGKGFTSRLLRLIINIKYNNGINNKSKNFPNQFSLILKIFADERIEVLVEHFIGKERLEKMILEVTKKLAIKENNEENLNNNCKNNEEINNKIILTKEDKMNTMKVNK